MSTTVALLIGTRKGLFIARSNEARATWDLEGPLCDGWPINHAVYDAETGVIFAAGGNPWYGAAVWRSPDFGKTWTHSSEGLGFPEGEDPLTNLWSLRVAPGVIYAGVEPAALFRSTDGGQVWEELPALRTHGTREQWYPGNAGLILHTIAVNPQAPEQIWIGISAAGVFFSPDGGQTWSPRNAGVRSPGPVEFAEVGQCVHHFELDAGSPERILQQNHMGMYASVDGGLTWHETPGLPSTFGFASAAHPRKPGTHFLAPLNGDIGGRYMPGAAAAIWRTTDLGQSWTALREGLPQRGAYFGVLRQAMATDSLDPAGVYFGTGTGHLFVSSTEGDAWSEVASYMPAITSIETAVLEG